MPMGLEDIEPLPNVIERPISKKMPTLEGNEDNENNTNNNESNNEQNITKNDLKIKKMIDQYTKDVDNIVYIKNIIEQEPNTDIKILFFVYDKLTKIKSLLTELKSKHLTSNDVLDIKLELDSLFIQLQYILNLKIKNKTLSDKIDYDYAPKKKPIKPLRKDWLDYGSPQFYY